MFTRNEIGDAAPSRRAFAWHQMEEFLPDGGMWVTPPAPDVAAHIANSAQLMRDPDAFRAGMRRALAEWPRSVSVAMATPGLNRRAWLGHAGCYLATGSPEETTRLGWHTLTLDEQVLANAAADDVIAEARPPRLGGLFDA